MTKKIEMNVWQKALALIVTFIVVNYVVSLLSPGSYLFPTVGFNLLLVGEVVIYAVVLAISVGILKGIVQFTKAEAVYTGKVMVGFNMVMSVLYLVAWNLTLYIPGGVIFSSSTTIFDLVQLVAMCFVSYYLCIKVLPKD